jgi:hypothetical protein
MEVVHRSFFVRSDQWMSKGTTMAAGTTTMFRRRRTGATSSPSYPITRTASELEANSPKNHGSPSKRERFQSTFQRIRKMATNHSANQAKAYSNYALIIGTLVFTVGIFLKGSTSSITSLPRRPTEPELEDLNIVLHHGIRNDVRPFYSFRTRRDEDKEGYRPSFGHLEFYSLQESPIFSRRIDPDDLEHYTELREEEIEEYDHNHFGDQYETDEDVEDQYPEPNPCRRNNWKSHKFPTCNSVHELTLERPTSTIQPFDISYLGYVLVLE